VAIDKFLSTIAENGGMSFSNNFIVRFINPPAVLAFKENSVAGLPGEAEYFEMFCNEAQLPNTNTAQGQMNGIYVGSGSVNYPHTRVFTELQLGFLCDANLTALKYMQDWVDSIFAETGDNKVGLSQESMISAAYQNSRAEGRNIRLRFRDDYVCTLGIMKAESGGNSPTERIPMTYILEQAYPYAIDAVPLQFGSSQLTQVTVQFSYMRHYVVKNDIRSLGKIVKDRD